MHTDTEALRAYFAKIGLPPEVASIYLALHAYGRQNLLQLARNARVERTHLYRLLDTLEANQLIEIETVYKRKLYRAAPVSNLQVLLTKKEQELYDLQKELQRLQAAFQPDIHRSPATRVQFYRGADGIRQMFWNETNCTTESLSILFENMQSRTNLAFFNRWVQRCNDRKIHFRSIVGPRFFETQADWYARHDNDKLRYWQGRTVLEAVLPVTHSMVTYDNVVAYYNWKDGEIFGIEIYNKEIADTQRAFFEMLWPQGTPVVGHGEQTART